MEQDNKYEKALALYQTELNDQEVREAVRKIIAERVHENDTPEVKKFLLGSVELTTLKTTDSEESVMAFTEKVNQFDDAYPDLPHVATICVYPNFAKTVAETLEVDGVEIACVSGSFPSSQTFTEIKIAETALAIKDGATEIDMVMPVGKFLSGNYEDVADEIACVWRAQDESDIRNRLSEDRFEYQESSHHSHVWWRRLYQDIDRKGRAGSYARGSLRDVSSHQGILR